MGRQDFLEGKKEFLGSCQGKELHEGEEEFLGWKEFPRSCQGE